MSRITWQDPPPVRSGQKRKKYKYNYLARACKNNPGRWAVFPKKVAVGYASRLRLKPEFEGIVFTSRIVKAGPNKGKYTLYMRFPATVEEETVVSPVESNGSEPVVNPLAAAIGGGTTGG